MVARLLYRLELYGIFRRLLKIILSVYIRNRDTHMGYTQRIHAKDTRTRKGYTPRRVSTNNPTTKNFVHIYYDNNNNEKFCP